MAGFLASFRALLAQVQHGPADPPEDASYCGCALEPGCWGAHGWHWRRHDIASLVAWEKRRFAAAREGHSRVQLREEWARWLMEEDEAGRLDEDGMHIAWKPYVGLPYAFQRCEPYMRAYRGSLEVSAAQRQRERRRDYDGRPANASWPKEVG